DLDGDGRPELVVAAGPWKAYDLRVLRGGSDGTLTLAARRTLGTIHALALLRTASGPVIALIKNDEYPNPRRFSRAHPSGPPAGLYLIGLRGDALEILGFAPAQHGDAPRQEMRRLSAGDLDGDGLDELIAADRDGAATLLRWQPGADPRPLVFPGLDPLLVLDLDGDGRSEIVAAPADDPTRVLVLGAGERVLSPAQRVLPAPRSPPAALTDPVAVAAWIRGEELVTIGLPRRTAAELAALAGLSGHGASDMFLRSAELHAGLGEHARAAELFLAAATRPEHAAAALGGAAESRRRLGEFATAAALTAARLRMPGQTPAALATIRRELTALQTAIAPRPQQTLDFALPLAQSWRIDDPLAVGRDLARQALSLWSSPAPTIAELPLLWDGGPATLEVELEVDRLEWGAELGVGIVGEGRDRMWIGARVGAYGANDDPVTTLSLFDDFRQKHHPTPVRAGTRIIARIAVFPAQGTRIDEVEIDGVLQHRRVQASAHGPDSAEPTPGPVRLRFTGVPVEADLVAHVWIRRIELVGFAPAAARPDPVPDPARLLAERDLVAALAALDPAHPLARVWRAEALAALGQVEPASAELRAFVADHPDDDPLYQHLHHRLRRGGDTLALAARSGLGDRHVDIVRGLLGRQPRDRDIADALVFWPEIPTDVPADSRGRARRVDLLYLRGLALLRAGRHDAAARSYAAAMTLLDDPARPVDDAASRREQLLLARAYLSAETGDIAATLTAIHTLLGESSTPALLLESLQADPALTSLLTADHWHALGAAPRE
ncbi:MAG TPA: VCBS repeat-containing protein, partial [Nannocystis sp.]